MNPPKQLLAIRAKKLDAAFLPEQWATMAEEYGFQMELTTKDVWPGMEGSVMAVKEDLIRNHPDLVRNLVNVTQKATRWINEHPREASAVVARQLSFAENPLFPDEVAGSARFKRVHEAGLCIQGPECGEPAFMVTPRRTPFC